MWNTQGDVENNSLQVLLDGGLEGLGVGTDDLADLLAVLEQDEGGHGADAEFLGDLGDLVDIELVEAGVGVRVREPFFWGRVLLACYSLFVWVFFRLVFSLPFESRERFGCPRLRRIALLRVEYWSGNGGNMEGVAYLTT